MSTDMQSVGNFCTKCTVIGVVAIALVTAATLVWVFML